MSFLKTIPQELLSAAAQLEGIGTSLTAQNAGAAAPTTAIAPAAADPVSILQSGIFSTYGTLYQQLAAEAQAIQQQFTSTLGLSSGTYSATEAANATTAQATGPVSTLINDISTLLGGPVTSFGGQPFSLSGNSANFLSFETGNWASAMSDSSVWPVVVCCPPPAPTSPTPARWMPWTRSRQRQAWAAWAVWAPLG